MIISKDVSKLVNSKIITRSLDDSWVCEWCGSEDVNQSAWVNVNTEEIVDFVDTSSYWCQDCNEEVQLTTFFEWEESIALYCKGNKDMYDEITAGSRR